MRCIFKGMNVLVVTFAFTSVAMADAKQLVSESENCNPIHELKRAYLRCERAAQTGALATGEIAACSEIYYDLKEKAFDGDFKKIRSWYEVSSSISASGSNAIIRPGNIQPNCG